MSFLDDESSAEDNRPVEFYTISTPTQSWALCSGNRPLTIDNGVYMPIPLARTEVAPASIGKATDLSLSLPVNHEIITRYLQLGNPPRTLTARIYRMQLRSGEIEQVWNGKVTSISIEDRVAKLRVPSIIGEALGRSLPQISRGKLCPHILYDTKCQVSRASNIVSTTVIYVDGRGVRVDLGSGKASPWSIGGELVHTASGERMTIQDQEDFGGSSTVTKLVMQMPIAGLGVGDAVDIYAGCDHTIAVCNSKFANQRNFGGFPRLNTRGGFTYVWHIKDQGA